FTGETMDARITMEAPDNTRGTAELTPERRALARRAIAPFFERTMAHQIPWVSCQFPTNAFAQEAGMLLDEFEDFFYGACLRDMDEGARFVGELGIGCNAGITRPMRNILFDEKMAGTVHIAIGKSYPHIGGKNVSSLHWDLIKDLRGGGRIELDGEVVQENGS